MFSVRINHAKQIVQMSTSLAPIRTTWTANGIVFATQVLFVMQRAIACYHPTAPYAPMSTRSTQIVDATRAARNLTTLNASPAMPVVSAKRVMQSIEATAFRGRSALAIVLMGWCFRTARLASLHALIGHPSAGMI